MHLEVECKRCQARYRVKDDLAGRMVQCKRCGQRFIVPARPAVVQLDEEDAVGEVDLQGAVESEQRTFEEYGVEGQTERGRGQESTASIFAGPLVKLPHEVSDVWLPIVVALGCFGVAGYRLVRHVLAGNGPVAGLVLIGAFALAFAWIVVPLVLRAVEGAAKTFDFELPNAVRLQTVAACGPAVLGAVLGLLGGGVSGMIAGAVVGIVAMAMLLVLFFQAAWVRVLQAGLFGAIVFALGTGVTGAVVLGAGQLLLPLWHMTLPWGEPPPVVAESKPVVVASVPTAVPVEVVVAPPKVEEPSTAPAAPPVAMVEELKWAPAVDTAGSAGSRWPVDLQRVTNVSVTATVVRADGGGPVIATVDEDECAAVDLRTGRVVGSVGERFTAATVRLSAGGKYVLAQRPPLTRPVTAPSAADLASGDVHQPFAPTVGGRQDVVTSTASGRPATEVVVLPASEGLELWSTGTAETSRLVGLVGTSVPVGFVGDDELVTYRDLGSKQEVEVWDVPSGQVVRRFVARLGPRQALSAGGQFLATIERGRVRVYDVEAGTLNGEAQVPGGAVGVVSALCFSPDGTGLAAVAGETSDARRLLVWNTRSGDLEQDVAVEGPGAASPGDGELWWTPDGRSLLCGSSLVDRGSGRAYWKLEPPAAFNGVAARARGMASNVHAEYEFVTPGAAKVLYKSVAIGAKRDVEAALRTVRGDKGEEVAGPPATTGPATMPAGTPGPALAARREWTITVTVVRKADPAALDKQMALERARLRDLEQQAAAKRRYADALATRIGKQYIVTRDPFGNVSRRSAPPPPALASAEADANRAADERKKLNGKILRMERERQAAEQARTLVGRVEDGAVVAVELDGLALLKAADECEPGSKWVVTGVGRVVDGEVRVRAKSVVAASDGK